MPILRQKIRIKSSVNEIIIEFTDPTGQIIEHTVFVGDAQALRHGKFWATGYPGKIDHEVLKNHHLKKGEKSNADTNT